MSLIESPASVASMTTATEPVTRPRDQRAVAVAFFFVSLGVMVLTLLLTLFFQSDWGYLLCVGMYATKVYAERRNGITSPLSISILAAYIAMLCASLAGVDYTGYAGAIIFTWLSVVVAVLLAIGRPFTTFYSHGRGLPSLHRVVSYIWLATYLSALAATLALIPNPLFLFVPALICIAGASATVFISFCWFGASNQRQKSFRKGDFDFTQITNAGADFQSFCDFYAQNIANDPRQGSGDKTWQEISSVVRDAETKLGADSVIFVCKHNGAIVGTIRCIVDRPGRPFPTEADIQSSFDPLRKRGRLMAVGRLAIADAYRARPDVMSGLFGGFVDLALEHDVSYVVSAGFTYVLPTYLKLGFAVLFSRADRRNNVRMSHGYVTHPVLLDFAELVTSKADPKDMKFGLYEVTNKYIAERWYKRAIVRRFLQRLQGKKRLAGLDDVRAILVDEHAPVPPGGALAESP